MITHILRLGFTDFEADTTFRLISRIDGGINTTLFIGRVDTDIESAKSLIRLLEYFVRENEGKKVSND